MRVMVANNTHWIAHYWAGLYGNLGHLFSPARKSVPLPHLPYALDNGAYSAFATGAAWDRAAFVEHVERYAFGALRPDWVVVPDVVSDWPATLRKWDEWAPVLSGVYHLPLALAVQDGATRDDVNALSPAPDVVFVGGSTDWKWDTVGSWCDWFPRVHVGRVNTAKYLEISAGAGAESCDGTGWFRGRSEQLAELGHFLRKQSGAPDVGDVEYIVKHSRYAAREQRCLPI